MAASRRRISAGASARGTVTWARFVRSFSVTVPAAGLVLADERGDADAEALGVLELLAGLVDLRIEDDARPGPAGVARAAQLTRQRQRVGLASRRSTAGP